MGWKGESRRHSLARKGIRTNIDQDRRFDVSTFVAKGRKYPEDAFETGDKLQAFLHTPLGQEYLEEHWESLFEIPFDSWRKGIPYWIDNYDNDITGENVFEREYEDEIIEHQTGFYDHYKIGEFRNFDGNPYYYVGGVSGGSGEMELQADSGELVYDSIGHSFFRIWKPFPKTYISFEEDGEYELIHNEKRVLTYPDIDNLKRIAKANKWELPNIIWDDYNNKFIKE